MRADIQDGLCGNAISSRLVWRVSISGDIVRQFQGNTQRWILAAKVGQRTSLMYGMIYYGSLS